MSTSTECKTTEPVKHEDAVITTDSNSEQQTYSYPSLWRLAPLVMLFIAALFRSLVDVMVNEPLPMAQGVDMENGEPAQIFLSELFIPQPVAVSKQAVVLAAVYGGDVGQSLSFVAAAASANNSAEGVLWSVKTQGRGCTSPYVMERSMLLPSKNNIEKQERTSVLEVVYHATAFEVIAMNVTNGAVFWRTQIQKQKKKNTNLLAMGLIYLLDSDALVIHTSDGVVVTLNALSGEQLADNTFLPCRGIDAKRWTYNPLPLLGSAMISDQLVSRLSPSLLPQHLFEFSVPQNCTSAPGRAMGNAIYIPGMAFDATDGSADNATYVGAVYSLELVAARTSDMKIPKYSWKANGFTLLKGGAPDSVRIDADSKQIYVADNLGSVHCLTHNLTKVWEKHVGVKLIRGAPLVGQAATPSKRHMYLALHNKLVCITVPKEGPFATYDGLAFPDIVWEFHARELYHHISGFGHAGVILSPPVFLNGGRFIAVGIGGTKRFAGTQAAGYFEFLLSSSIAILNSTDGSLVKLHHSHGALGTSLVVHENEQGASLYASVWPVWKDVSKYVWGANKLTAAALANTSESSFISDRAFGVAVVAHESYE